MPMLMALAMLMLMPLAMVMLMVLVMVGVRAIHPVTCGSANGNGNAHDNGDGTPFASYAPCDVWELDVIRLGNGNRNLLTVLVQWSFTFDLR